MRALVLGGAVSVWDDMAAARRLGAFDAVVVINDVATLYPDEIDIWVTLHPEHLGKWAKARREKGFPDPKMIAAHKRNTKEKDGETPGVDYATEHMWPGMASSGSSGLFAPKVAMEQGFDRIVLCGVPMQGEIHNVVRKRAWGEAGGFWHQWQPALPYIKDTVRSMSGRTRKLLGGPTEEWLTSGGMGARPGRIPRA